MAERNDRISAWVQSFCTLPDDYFFEIMRMYLGDIESPFNKSNLVERLASFLRKDECKKNIAAFLSQKDVQILSAIKFLPNSSTEEIYTFLTGEFTLSEFEENLESLEDRLLIYLSKVDAKEVLDINPMLDDVLEPYLGIDQLLYEKSVCDFEEKPFVLTADFIASYISFVSCHKDLLKNDMSFKKRALSEMEEMYGSENEYVISLLTKAFLNLGIFDFDEKCVSVDFDKAFEFAKLDEVDQLIYIAIFSVMKISKSNFEKLANLFYVTLLSLPEEGASLSKISRMQKLLMRQNGREKNLSFSRLSNIFRASAIYTPQELNEKILSINYFGIGGPGDEVFIDVVENAISLALLYNKGLVKKEKSEDETYALSSYMKKLLSKNSFEKKSEEEKKVLSMDADFSITIMPGLSLKELLPLMKFLQIKTFDTASVYEIKKQSLKHAFDLGLSVEELFALLEKYSYFEIPQNIKMNIEEWYDSYTAASLYNGYVLKLSKEKADLVKDNPNFCSHVKEVLAEGIYFLDFKSEDEARTVLAKCSLDFLGKTKTALKKDQALPFASLEKDLSSLKNCDSQKKVSESFQAEKIFSKMQKALDKRISSEPKENNKNLQKEIESLLTEWIERKIIIDENQLLTKNLHTEILEASGADYSGKMHVIESAISTNSMIELEVRGMPGIIVGYPDSLNKKSPDGDFCLTEKNSPGALYLQVSSVIRVKKLRSRIRLNSSLRGKIH